MGAPKQTYERPSLVDFGDLVNLTAACQGFGGEDGADKGFEPFTMSQPDGGDAGFCDGP